MKDKKEMTFENIKNTCKDKVVTLLQLEGLVEDKYNQAQMWDADSLWHNLWLIILTRFMFSLLGKETEDTNEHYTDLSTRWVIESPEQVYFTIINTYFDNKSNMVCRNTIGQEMQYTINRPETLIIC